ncbi:MAG TPA: T9SS type A sorting domain-containing protein [Flavobacteriales bacterium]|nr:T9SS type A sorting domain-containing protein [Flavobacteriales bacterium]
MGCANRSAAFLAAVLLAKSSWTQTSVFDCPLPVQNSDITSPFVETGGCFDFSHPSNYNYPSGANKEFRAYKHIRVEDDFKMGSSSSSGGKFKLTMMNADIVLYEPNDLSGVPRYEKMELGIDLPDGIQARVDAFIADETDPHGLNPFLEWKIKIEATFTHAGSGFIQKKVDAFYFRDFERTSAGATYPPYLNNEDPAYKNWGGSWEPLSTEHPFRIRFAPTELGTWVCQVKVYIDNNPVAQHTYPVFSFTVSPSGNPGFLKVGTNKRFFKRGNETFVPMGPNFGWPVTHKTLNTDDFNDLTAGPGNTEQYRWFTAPLQTFKNYETHLNTLSDAGANHFRLIMVPHSLDIEFEKLGNYYDRMNIAWEMDNIVNTAKQKNLDIQWNLQIQYTWEGNPFGSRCWDWYAAHEYEAFDPAYAGHVDFVRDAGYCYRVIEGSTLNGPVDMFSHPLAIKYYKQRLRYIISRWGYSTNIGMWELCSEVNLVGDVRKYIITNVAQPPPYLTDPVVQNHVEDWHSEMSNYIKNTLGDPHPISASYANDVGIADNTHNLSTIDFVSENHYNPYWSPMFVHEVSKAGSYIDRMGSYGSGKPVSFSETGLLNAYECMDAPGTFEDIKNFEQKRLTWLLAFSGTAIQGDWTFWDYPGEWYLYKDIREFIGDINLDQENWIPGQYTTSFTPTLFSAWDDMERGDNKADMTYLRSGDKRYAMGTINNRTYNAYSMTNLSCADGYLGIYNNASNDPDDELEDVDFRVKETVSAETTPANWLRIRDMDGSPSDPILYVVEYFDVDDPNVFIEVQLVTNTTGNIVLEHPDLNDDHPVLAFRLYPRDTGWKMAHAQSNTTQNSENIGMEVYPNPTNGELTIQVNGFNPENKNQKLVLFNALGEQLQTINVTSEKTIFDLSSYENGIYLISFCDGISAETVRVPKINY